MIEPWGDDFGDSLRPNNSSNISGVNITGPGDWEHYVEDYMDWLGDDWDRPRYFIGSAIGAAFVVFIWVLGMMCIAHVRSLRILAAALPFFGIMPLQFASLSVLNSDFCKERKCVLDRSGVGAVCAGFMYFAAGIALMFTKSFVSIGDDELEAAPESYQQRSVDEPPGIEMVDIVEDASFVIEDDRARAHANQAQSVVIGDGLAEALEIKPDMIFLHEDGEEPKPGACT